MRQQRTLGPKDVDKAVAEFDDVRQSVFFRDPDRPDGRFIREQGRHRSLDVIRAQGRLRAARWRSEQDRKKSPTLEQIGKSLCVALVTSRLEELTGGERSLVRRMLADLESRGFDRKESQKTLRRLRNRLTDPADRQGEPTETTGPAITPSAWRQPDDPVF